MHQRPTVTVTFLDLPRELRQRIARYLHVTDRFRLNRALSPRERDPVSELDRQLAVVWRLFTQPGLLPPERVLPRALVRFLQEHAADPTVARILLTHALELPPTRVSRSDAFVDKFKRGVATPADVAALTDAEIDNYEFVTALIQSVEHGVTPAHIEFVMRDARLLHAVERIPNKWLAGYLVQDAFNLRCPSAATLDYLCAHRDDNAFVRRGIEVMRTKACLLAHGAEAVTCVLERFGLTDDAKRAILADAIQAFNVDVIILMVNALA